MIIKVKHQVDYTVVCNKVLNDITDACAIGILVYLLSKPSGWQVNKKQIYKHFTQGRTRIDNAFKVLEESGYLQKVRVKLENGRFDGWDWIVTDQPDTLVNDVYNAENRNEKNRNAKNGISEIEQLLSKEVQSKELVSKEVLKEELLDFENLRLNINKYTGRSFKVINPDIRRRFRARLKDGYTKDMILQAIKSASSSEAHKENGCQYLTPEFFSRASTLDKWGVRTAVKKEQKSTFDDYSPH